MRDLSELLSDDPAWPYILSTIAEGRPAEPLPQARASGERALLALQVTDRSPMGGIALNCGGIVAAGGWLRVFGGGDPGLTTWNHTHGGPAAIRDALDGALVVGADVLGGFFLLDGGGLGHPGTVHHLAADTLDIHDLGVGYGAWLQWVLTGDISTYYQPLRWAGWEQEISRLAWSQGLHVYPPPWTREGRDVGAASRRPVPLVELWGLAWERRQSLSSPG